VSALRTAMLLVPRAARAAVVTVLIVAAVSSIACFDPEHSNEVNALGGEAPGVSPGPLHRPGQPCLVCHGGQGPAKVQFSIGGTAFAANASAQPSNGAEIQLEDVTGSSWHVTANTAGNFFVLQSDWSPTYPLSVPTVTDSSGKANPLHQMITIDNRDGSCAGCHTLTPGTDSVGPVYIYPPAGG
jgi:hypothetical protein